MGLRRSLVSLGVCPPLSKPGPGTLTSGLNNPKAAIGLERTQHDTVINQQVEQGFTINPDLALLGIGCAVQRLKSGLGSEKRHAGGHS